jgi:hypothetical protein
MVGFGAGRVLAAGGSKVISAFARDAAQGGEASAATALATGSAEGAAEMQGRAAALNASRDAWMAQRGTTAAIRAQHTGTGEIRTFIATESRTMPAEFEGQLGAGETFVEGAGHAEQTIFNSLDDSSWRLLEGGASRNVCKDVCAPLIKDSGGELGGPTFRGLSDKTPYRMFWWAW